ncbi:YfgG family protein [Erwinia tracheiphila]|uniref:YfgG family protein n=1 Tax=Erwinia tracheiphila TaxID=65700 RepID=UPI0003403FA4|nr:YfgG family protein [Erwinia tracheiphila]EOS96262.1 hypothetical protein ETR_03829 [Erwinia tracheiphila PSU-1]UIA86847.1 YfgG family protein [Erwinia tracheiphila]UIA95203.1 YfgG family protein [Erwinia tracheiphila]
MPFRKHKKTGRMARIILLVSFIILIGRLVYVITGAIDQQQQKKQDVATPVTSTRA